MVQMCASFGPVDFSLQWSLKNIPKCHQICNKSFLVKKKLFMNCCLKDFLTLFYAASGSSASRDSSFPRRNRDRRGNSGSRNNSPANHQRKDSAKYNKVSYCSACGSNTHTQNSCFRYPETSKVTEPCSYCLKNGRRLYHQYQYCCYRESKYKSPNRNGSKN